MKNEGQRITFSRPGDFMRLHLIVGQIDLTLNPESDWPPPERIFFDDAGPIREARDDDPPNMVMHRTNYSRLTDEQMEGASHIARGAEYRYPEEAGDG